MVGQKKSRFHVPPKNTKIPTANFQKVSGQQRNEKSPTHLLLGSKWEIILTKD